MRAVLFFFSSRRRHTRYWRDWSSDVCSSDLAERLPPDSKPKRSSNPRPSWSADRTLRRGPSSSEERRVGKECRSRWSPYHLKKNLHLLGQARLSAGPGLTAHRARVLAVRIDAYPVLGRARHRLYCFFSSRRRHTRYWRDWSSDVCSSDLEALTGVNLIIDDTPEAVLLSCFDPVRREIGRLTLEKLVSDGRIHPARIEETYDRAKQEVEGEVRRAGEDACLEVGITDLHPELVRVLGRLKYRTSYGQNVLRHLIETAHLAGIMASELGMDIALAKRCGFLHDIGKALTHEVEGSHAIIGAELARRLKERPEVVHAIEAHHGEVEQRTVEAVLTQAADAISGGRPGARRETLESYVKRLERLEEIAGSYPGVDKVFAMQAGREVRIMVKPEDVDDVAAQVLARDMAKRVEQELQYPGQIKITVVREIRSIEYAK